MELMVLRLVEELMLSVPWYTLDEAVSSDR